MAGGRWLAVLLLAVAARIALDPGTNKYYAAGAVAVALLWDLVAGEGAGGLDGGEQAVRGGLAGTGDQADHPGRGAEDALQGRFGHAGPRQPLAGWTSCARPGCAAFRISSAVHSHDRAATIPVAGADESEDPVVGAGPRVVIISASVGSGHDGAATELSRRLCAAGATVTRHDFVDLMPGRTGVLLRSFYRRQLEFAPQSWGWLLAAGKHRSLSAPTRLADAETLRVVGSRADVVVSTYPLASQVLGRLRRTGQLTIPTVTYLTDMSVHPQWIANGVDTHLAIHDEPATQARKLGARDVHVVTPVVDPAFTRAAPPSSRERWGLPENVPLALIVAGAWGVGEIEQTARDVAATGLAVAVVACGQNERLRHRLGGSGSTTALGWIDDMPALLRNCQVVVQNAGGLSSLEALHAGVPVITYRSLPGHGRDNAEALDRAGWVPWLRTPAELAGGLRAALTPLRDRPDLTGLSPESVIITRLPVPA